MNLLVTLPHDNAAILMGAMAWATVVPLVPRVRDESAVRALSTLQCCHEHAEQRRDPVIHDRRRAPRSD